MYDGGGLQIFFVINWKFPTLTWKNRASLTCNITIICSKDTYRILVTQEMITYCFKAAKKEKSPTKIGHLKIEHKIG